jgi:F-type H+-transporting ATPase subunit b
MTSKINFYSIGLAGILLICFSFPPLAIAAEHGREQAATAAEESTHEEAAAEHGESWIDVIARWVNLAALVALLYLFLGRSMRVQDRFKADYEQIQRSIESARLAKEQAEAQLEELDQKMAGVNDEIARLKAQAAREAEEEKKRILDSAQKEAERIIEMAHREIDTEVELARRSLRAQIAEISISEGKKIIEREINEHDQKRLLQEYIREFGK